MEFQNNVAFLYDSSILSIDRSHIYSIMSFTGNPAYINAFACDLIKKYDLKSIEEMGFESWINDAQKNIRLLDLLRTLAENKDKFGIISNFVDKNYGLYIFFVGMLFPNIENYNDNFTVFFDSVYRQYLKKIAVVEGGGNLRSNFEILNRYVKGIIHTQSEYSRFRPYYVDNSEKMINLIEALESSNISSDNFLSEFMMYSRNLIKAYQTLGVNDIRATKNAGERLQSTVRLMSINDYFRINIMTDKESNDSLRLLAEILLKLMDYNMEKISGTGDVKDMSESDRFLFVITWSLFQGMKNDWVFSKDTFQKIKDLFESVKNELNV